MQWQAFSPIHQEGNIMKKIILFSTLLAYVITGCSSNGLQEQEKLSDELILAQERAVMYKIELDQLQRENSQLKLQLDMYELASEIETTKKTAEQALEQEEKPFQAKLERILLRFSSHYDEVRDMTYYKDATSPQKSQENAFYAYISVNQEDEVGLRLRIQYCGESWIFAEHYTIDTDENSYSIEPEHYDLIRYQNLAGMVEYYDFEVSKEHISMLQDIMNSNQTVIKHEGVLQVYEYIISSSEKFALQNILLAYDTLTLLQ